MTIWLLLLGMGVITFVNRYLFLADSIPYSPGPKLKRFLGYSSYAVLTAIWAPIVFQFDGVNQISIAGVDYLLAASIAAVLSFCRVPSIIVVLLATTVFFLVRFYIAV